MLVRNSILAVVGWLGSIAATAQVPNDDIANRRVLQLEEQVVSSTTGCTVQQACVDERLTGKCIEYHNDQWFTFTPTITGQYFVNIGQQKCRDVRGVQLVVLTGQPCQPKTYRILNCISLGTQDDVFVVLKNLQAGQPCLLNVDGYLKDFCQFTLQVSRQATGSPAWLLPLLATEALPGTNRVVHLEWTLPDSLANAAYCRVLRREAHAFRSSERGRVAVGRNTLGGQPSTYAVADTLPAPGYYLYQVMTAGDLSGHPPVVLQQQWVSFSQLNPLLDQPAAAPHIVLPLGKYPRRAQLSVIVSDPATGRVLLARQLVNQPDDFQQGWLPVSGWQDLGIQKISVQITGHPLRGRFFTDRLLLSLPSPVPVR